VIGKTGTTSSVCQGQTSQTTAAHPAADLRGIQNNNEYYLTLEPIKGLKKKVRNRFLRFKRFLPLHIKILGMKS
jgi:hypothetical protein